MLEQLRSRTTNWQAEGPSRVPLWIYSDPDLYARELEVIFYGPTWNYVGLTSEIPERGSFKRTFVGERPVIMTRDEDGNINVFVNRCAHRGIEFCREHRGKVNEFVCPYHQWTYDLRGDLQGIPFKRGIKGEADSGMPADFNNKHHNLRKLNVECLYGVVFASFADDMEPVAQYLGKEVLEDFAVVFKDRKLKILGYYRNELPGNWKLYQENLKDPYHATLLHSFLVTFGLMVAGSKTSMIADPTGRHGTMASRRPDDVSKVVDTNTAKEMRAYRTDLKLADTRFLEFIPEFNSPWTVTMQTIWPNMIVQRELNTLGVRQIVPNGPNSQIMIWTMFGYETDTPEMTRHRLRQGNLMGPSGFLGLEDNEAIKFLQEGVRRSPSDRGVLKLGGKSEGTGGIISESAIRAMYRSYREVMEL